MTWSEKVYGLDKLKELVAERVKDPDIAVNTLLMKIFTTWPPRYHTFFFDVLLHNLDCKFWRDRSAQEIFDKVKVPVYLKCGWAPTGRWSATVLGAFADSPPGHPQAGRGHGSLRRPGTALPLHERGVPALVRPLAEGHRHRHYGRAAAEAERDRGRLPLREGMALARTEYRKMYLRNFERLRWDPDPSRGCRRTASPTARQASPTRSRPWCTPARCSPARPSSPGM